jgi:AcrR family transcriptional regulator
VAKNRARTGAGQAPGGTDRYAALIAAAQQAFVTKGYAAASTEEIAQAAGVSKSLVFRHFGNKAGLFARAVVDPLLSFLSDFSSAWESPEWAASDLETITTRFVVDLYDRMCALRPMLTALLAVTLHDVQPSPELDAIRTRLEELFDRTVEENRKAARRFDITGVDAQLAVRITFGLVFAMAVLDDWLLGTMPRRPSRKRILSELAAFITAATRSRPTPSPPIEIRADPDALGTPIDRTTGRRAWGSAPQQLLETAVAVFAEKGYASATTKEIAGRAGIAESLLFFHYPTKQDLFTHAVFQPFLDTVESFTGEWDRAEWQSHPVEDTTRSFITKLYSWIQADRPLLIAMIHSSILGDEAGPRFPQARLALRALFDRVEAEHTKARQYHGLAQLDPPLTVRATFATVLALTVLDHWLLAGIGPPPGRAEILGELVGYLTAATLRPA